MAKFIFLWRKYKLFYFLVHRLWCCPYWLVNEMVSCQNKNIVRDTVPTATWRKHVKKETVSKRLWSNCACVSTRSDSNFDCSSRNLSEKSCSGRSWFSAHSVCGEEFAFLKKTFGQDQTILTFSFNQCRIIYPGDSNKEVLSWGQVKFLSLGW